MNGNFISEISRGHNPSKSEDDSVSLEMLDN